MHDRKTVHAVASVSVCEDQGDEQKTMIKAGSSLMKIHTYTCTAPHIVHITYYCMLHII